MNVKIWLLAAFLFVACDGFSFQADMKNLEGKTKWFSESYLLTSIVLLESC